MFVRRTVCLLIFSLVVVIAGTLPATAQSSGESMPVASRILSPIDDRLRVKIPQSTHPLVRPESDIGAVDGGTLLQRMILLLTGSPDQEYQARTLLDSQQTKGSPNYHHWLTPEEYGERFGPSQQDIAQVTNWLKQSGFSVQNIAKGRHWIEFSGTSAQVEAAFQTHMLRYQIQGAQHVANATDISIPAALAPVVRGVVSLHDFYSKPEIQRFEAMRPVRLDRSKPNAKGSNPLYIGSNGSNYITPGDLAVIY